MCSGIIEMWPAELMWPCTVLGLWRLVMTPNLIISVKGCWKWDFSMIHARTKNYLDCFQDSILISIQYIGLTCNKQPKNTNTEGHCAGLPTDFIRTDLCTTLEVAWMWQRDACPAVKTYVSFFSLLSPLLKGVPGKNLLPRGSKFFLTSKLDPPPPSPAIYGNIAGGFSFLRHHATKDIISLTAWLLSAPVCTVSIQAIWVKTIEQNPIYDIFSKKFPWFN